METLLVIAAHPDDELLGLGATVKKFVNAGHEAYALILSCGITSRYDSRKDGVQEQIGALKEQSRAAAKILGFKQIFLCDLPDNQFDSLPLLEITKEIEKYVQTIKPSIIFTHHYSDVNIDHQRTFQAVITATRPFGDYSAKEIYCFETFSSTEWSFPYQGAFKPNMFVDVEQTFKDKLEAMQCYTSELRPYPHPRSLKSLEVAAKRWGTVVGCNLAEAFELVRKVVK